ncbi:FtsQ-type POTRA domain-containing protein [Streptococcus dentapri]|uniref:Cell division protein DivIB n=1 Tax=Streptococcus dentapri TaxID=573564 RepID=A0ABV8CZC8_9STRE
MAKKKDKAPKEQEEKMELTEWQKRNLDFLKQKEKEKKEQEKLQKELVAKKRERIQGKDLNKEQEEPDKKGKKSTSSAKSKSGGKKVKPKSATKQKLQVKKKVKPKSTKFKRRLISILVPAILGILFALYLMTPASKIKHVSVEGVNHTTSDSVLKASGLTDDQYTFSTVFNSGNIARAVEKRDVWVKSAKVNYKFPFTFTIGVKEYNIVAYAQTDQGYVPILENGRRLDSVQSSDLPEKFTTINIDNGKYLSTLIKKLTKMDQKLISEIKVITLAGSKVTPDLLNLEMQDGNTVRVPLSDIDRKLIYYDDIKSKLRDNHIIDMEVGIYATNDDNNDDSTEETQEQSEDGNQNQNPETENSSQDNPEQSEEQPQENVDQAADSA